MGIHLFFLKSRHRGPDIMSRVGGSAHVAPQNVSKTLYLFHGINNRHALNLTGQDKKWTGQDKTTKNKTRQDKTRQDIFFFDLSETDKCCFLGVIVKHLNPQNARKPRSAKAKHLTPELRLWFLGGPAGASAKRQRPTSSVKSHFGAPKRQKQRVPSK